MTAIKHRNAWIWVAVAAVSLAFVARAQAGVQNARAYTNPVLEFLAGHPNDETVTAGGVHKYLHPRCTRAVVHGTDSDTFAAMLPVLFVGLVSPLNVLAPRSVLCVGRAPSAPLLPFSFQRPPPTILL